jgi:ferritin-like metal-binding protein YciE
MGLFTPDNDTLRELYTVQLQKALNMEKQIVEALPNMIEKSSRQELANAFRTHLEESKEQYSRLERILTETAGEASDKKCPAASALISEGNSDISDAGNPEIRDVVLIAAGNQIEHHEIAVYGTLIAWAQALGQDKHAATMSKSLEEEKHADKVLTQLAEQINVAAPVA